MNTAQLAMTFAAVAFLSLQSHHAVADTFGSGANAFQIEFVSVGNLGNPADTTGHPNPAGSVPYEFRMGKYEVSRDMVTKASGEGNLGISLNDMSFVTGGPRPNMPAIGASWNEMARFVNWLNTSQGFPAAYKFSTQPGGVGYSANENILLWQAGDPGFDAANPFRNSLAHYFLPSSDESYKSAYYDPNANGGAGGYWNYPTGSDLAPTCVASGTATGTAVCSQSDQQGPADVSQAGGLSPYGTMAQAGNVWEVLETQHNLINNNAAGDRISRGGDWIQSDSPQSAMAAACCTTSPMNEGAINDGFRVASVAQSDTVLPGDYNGNSVVDAADYVLWRKNDGPPADYHQWRAHFGQTSLTTPGDYNNDGTVDAADYIVWRRNDGTEQGYNTWRTNFGRTGATGAGAASDVFGGAVPEPSSVVQLLFVTVAVLAVPHRRLVAKNRC